MDQTLTIRFRRWFEYEQDSHAKVLASLDAVPAPLRSTDGYRKALALMAHIAIARRLWLSRLDAGVEAPRELFPADPALSETRALLAETGAAWTEWLARADDDALAHRVEYRSIEGKWYRSTVVDVVTQLAGHSWHHRGQIATLLRSIGAQPAITDFIYWTREAIPAPTTTQPGPRGA